MSNFAIAKALVQKLTDAGHIAYFAGGWVRDFIMGHPSDDIDIATSATVQQVQGLFDKTIPVGIAFGIVIVVLEGHSFEVASFRKDLSYEDGRRPSAIDKANPEEDAHRRDFTINGLFFNPLTEEIIDYVQGKEDIEKKIIRAIGSPHARFREDRLRMMRAVRYATRFSFTIEPSTLEAIKIHASEITPAVAIERIWQEFKKMSRFEHFDTGLVKLFELGLLARIFPSLQNIPLEEIKNRARHICNFPKDTPPIAELLELFPDFSLEQVQEFCDRLKLSAHEKKFAHFLKHFTTVLEMPKAWQQKLERIEWAYLYADSHEELVLAIVSSKKEGGEKEDFIREHQERKASLKEAIQRIREKNPIVTAEHLLREGIQAGPQLGKLLKEAERICINANLFDPMKVVDKLKKSPLWTS